MFYVVEIRRLLHGGVDAQLVLSGDNELAGFIGVAAIGGAP
jgi:hypothetical protein